MITATNCRVPAVGQATPQTVSFTYPITVNSDVVVWKVVTATGAATVLSEGANYTVVNNGAAGGSITTLAAAGTSNTLEVFRRSSPTQALDLVNGGAFDGPTIEASLDLLTKLVQEAQDALAVAATIPGGVYTPGTAALLNVATDLTANSDSLIPTQKAVKTAITAAIPTGTAVVTTGNQSIAGVKTFASSPIVPTPTSGSASGSVASKGYVDSFQGVAGSVLQDVMALDFSVQTFKTVIALNTTLLTSASGSAAAATLSITPKATGNNINVRAVLNVTGTRAVVLMVLNNTTVIAVATCSGTLQQVELNAQFTAANANAQTISIRIGVTAGSAYTNTDGATHLGGLWWKALSTCIRASEVQA
jgi:hypothetical protein